MTLDNELYNLKKDIMTSKTKIIDVQNDLNKVLSYYKYIEQLPKIITFTNKLHGGIATIGGLTFISGLTFLLFL